MLLRSMLNTTLTASSLTRPKCFSTLYKSSLLNSTPFSRTTYNKQLGAVRYYSSKLDGSYHWNAERALSIVSVPLLATAFVAGPIPLVDFALGWVLPLHCHIGFDAMIQDYLPARRAKILNLILSWTLRLTTALVIYGCYLFNTNDVGITAFVGRLWTGGNKE